MFGMWSPLQEERLSAYAYEEARVTYGNSNTCEEVEGQLKH